MLKTFTNTFKISFTENANSFIYFLRKIPKIGGRISETLYKQTKDKFIIGIIREILGILGGFLIKGLYLGLMIILPSYLMTKNIEQILPEFLHIFFFLSFILGSIMETIIFDSINKSAFNMIRLMRVEPRKYYLSQIIYKKLENFICFILPMIVIGKIIGFSTMKSIVLILELTAFKVMGEGLQLFIYDKTGKIINNETLILSIIIIMGLAFAYALPFLGLTIDFYTILFNIFVEITTLILGILSYIYIWKYRSYTKIAKSILTKEHLFDVEDFEENLNFGDVKIDEKKINENDLNIDIYNKKQGYEYLNAIFFKRHRRILVTPIKIRVLIIGIVFLVSLGFLMFMPENKVKFIQRIKNGGPILVFAMYMMSTGERICKAMFYNCDVKLLRYGYYRESNAILSNFTSRLKRVVFLNIIPALVLCLAIIGITIFSGSGFQVMGMAPLFVSILCLSCFFSIHHLFLYYVIQPYTAELTIKSPLFKFMNFIVYMISYICLQIKTSSSYFALGVILITVVYMVVTLILTYKLAPKTFKLR
ncbi:MAG: hypothetical protein KZY61_01255 [Clostridiaceae bacterium]|nr:hypothetical protein [Clostridiaceae bacterium]MBW4859437.1 hypothetical protein [Clostridiaceae bacterium]MBW4867282.1 hypothetical protein [Clostridiaceae bacterium]